MKASKSVLIILSFILILPFIGQNFTPPSVAAAGNNLLDNGDFEIVESNKPAGWKLSLPSMGTETYEASNDHVYRGSYSVRIDDQSDVQTVGLRSDKVSVVPGQDYTASVMVYIINGESSLYLEFWNASGSRISTKSVGNNSNKNWVEMNVSSEAPANATHATILLYSNSTNVGTAYFDDAYFGIAVMPLALLEARISTGRTDYYIGQKLEPAIEAVMNDGSTLPLENASVTVTSSDDAVIAVSTLPNQRWSLEALTEGEARITVKITYGEREGLAFVDLNILDSANIQSSKQRSTIYTDEKIANARHNIELYDWARYERDNAVTLADSYEVLGLDFWWSLITPQSIPRGYAVNQVKGSPVTGTAINQFGNYPYRLDPINHPWKIQDPTNDMWYPCNDFGAYYESGLVDGVFVKSTANASLLTNTSCPGKPADWGIDDGSGWVDASGNRFTFIAYYNHWAIWYGANALLPKALQSLRDAYLFTGDEKYAATGIVILDRIADLYPDMDLRIYKPAQGYLNSDGGTGGRGKVVGSIWESLMVQDWIRAYDAFFPAMDHPGALAFLQNKANSTSSLTPKNSAAAIRKNIEDGILKQIYPAIQNDLIRGNEGMHQLTLALAAVVYDTFPETKEWLDFNFQAGSYVSSEHKITGGNILPLLVSKVDRDGHGDETAPLYNRLWFDQFKQVADVLQGYDKYPAADLYQHPKFKKMFDAYYPLTLSDQFTAHIGDSGGTGNGGIITKAIDFVDAFKIYGDPIYAQLAYQLNGRTIGGIRGDIFDADPSQLTNDIADVIAQYGTFKPQSNHLTGYGFSVLRAGQNYTMAAINPIFFTDMRIIELSEGTSTKYFPASSTLQFEAINAQSAISFEFNVEKHGVFDLDLRPFTAASYGDYDIYYDDVKIATHSFTGTLAANSPSVTLAKDLNITPGKHKLTFRSAGLGNGSSYKFGAISISLIDESSRQQMELANTFGNEIRELFMYYGRSGSSHAHADSLNLGVLAYGYDLAPDLGYPERTGAWPSRIEWSSHTVSHNTVLVDRSRQKALWGATPLHFEGNGPIQLIDVDASDAYDQTSQYRRTAAMIHVDDSRSYMVDLFRIAGGDEHHYSFHGGEGTVATDGLQLISQPTGTLAGPDVEYGVRPANDSVPGTGYMGSGFHYLKDVEKDESVTQPFSVDWTMKNNGINNNKEVHMKLTMLNDVSSVALATGIPPVTGQNPGELRYMMAERKGSDIHSVFASVIQPYVGTPFIDEIEKVSVTYNGQIVSDEEAVAIKVVIGERTDWIIQAMDRNKLYVVDDRIAFQGYFGTYIEQSGKEAQAYLNDGVTLGYTDNPLIAKVTDRVEGTIVDFTRILTDDNQITIQTTAQSTSEHMLEQWIGRYIHVANQSGRNAVYEIKSVDSIGTGQYILHLGNSTLIHRYVDDHDFSKGFVYDIAPGDVFYIPLSYIREGGSESTQASLTVNGSVSQASTGTAGRLSVTVVDPISGSADVTALASYTSSDNSVAEVLAGGVILYKAAGTTIIGATYGELAAEPLEIQVVGTAASTAAPGKPILSHNNGHDTGLRDGDYTVAMNMWWGNNGSVYRLYENDVLIETNVIIDHSPTTQTTATAISGRANGVYTYRAELINGYGVTTSNPLIVTVTDATPGTPVLFHDNWDGDGSFAVTMNMWWGTNGTAYRLYENGVLIDEQPLTAATPGAQTARIQISGKPVGTYVYRVELLNEAGVTSSAVLSVTVVR